jgi:hypothetical protein
VPRAAFALFLWLWLNGLSGAGFEAPLSEHSVREAYFLGQRNNDATAAFLREYARALPLPKRGVYVSQVWLLTPYAQVVRTSGRHSVGYSAQQAAAEYHGLGDSLLIEVRFEFTPTYGFTDAQRDAENTGAELNRHLDVEDFWRAYRFLLAQSQPKEAAANNSSQTTAASTDSPEEESAITRTLEPQEVRAEPIYVEGSLHGALVFLRYDAFQAASAPTTFTVTSPDLSDVSAAFDLQKLR